MPIDTSKLGGGESTRTPAKKKAEGREMKTNEPLEQEIARLKERVYPTTVQPVILIHDDSESMADFREAMAKLAGDIQTYLVTTGNERALTMVYLLVLVIAKDGIKTNGFQRLGEATPVEHEPDGMTELGTACGKGVDIGEEFIGKTLVEAESRAKPVQVIVLSDLEATGETEEETKNGITKLKAFVKKYRGRITLVGPAEADTDQDLAKQFLAGTESKPVYLGTDPSKILRVSLDSMS